VNVAGSTVTLSDATLSGNQANGGHGGAGKIAHNAGGNGGNGGGGAGGGVAVSTGTITLINDTLSSNIARGANGGNAGDAKTFGTPGNGGNAGGGLGGGLYTASGSWANTLIVDNSVNAGTPGAGGSAYTSLNSTAKRFGATGGGGTVSGPDVWSTAASGDHDVIGNGSGSNLTNGSNGDQVGSIAPFTGDLGKGSATIYYVSTNPTGLAVGQLVTDTDGALPAGTVITGLGPTMSPYGGITLSQAATETENNGDTFYAFADPHLGPLQDNGGPLAGAPGSEQVVPTIALLPGSSAIDAGDPSAPGLPSADQRGFARSAGIVVDIGAYESGATPATTDLSISGNPPSSVAPGGQITYTLTVSNNSSSAQSNVTLVDNLPANTTLVSWTAPSGVWSSGAPAPGSSRGTVSCWIPTLPADTSATFTLVIQLDSDTPAGTVISNTASVGPITGDPNPSNNSVTFQTTATPYVDGNGVLQVQGRHANDKIVLEPNPSNASYTDVVDNGTVVGTFANAFFSSINVQLLTGDSLTLADTGGSSGLGFFTAPVTVAGGGGASTLTLDDSTSSSANTYTVTSNSVSRSGFGGVTFTNLQSVSLFDGTGTNTVNVLSTSASLNLQTDGQDSVYVGSNGSGLGGDVQGINGAVLVYGAGATALTVDDSGDSTGRTATLFNVPFFSTFLGGITGLAPANIEWIPTSGTSGGVTGLTVDGSGGNTFTVTGTSNFYGATTLSTGTGYNTVNVEGTTGLLYVDNPGGQDQVYVGRNGSALGGTVQAINGEVAVYGAGATVLIVDDGGDTTGRTATLSNSPYYGSFLGEITGLAPAPIAWIPTSSASGGVTGLLVYGGSGGNTFTVTNTSNFHDTTGLSTGTGNDTVNVEATTGSLSVDNPGGQDSVYVGSNGSALGGNVQGITGGMTVYGAGATTLTVDDSGDTTGRTVTLANAPFGWITGLAPATINWIPTSSASGGVTGLNVYGGSGGNTFTVTNTSSFNAYTTLSTGTGNDTVNVEATTGTLYVNNPGGQDSVYVGSNGSALGGNVQGINGGVYVQGPGGTLLVVDDDGDTVGHTATLSDGAITGLAPATVHWTPTSGTTGGVSELAVLDGSGGSTYNVTNTSNIHYGTYLQTGTGNDAVNITATTGSLTVYNGGGTDSVVVGSQAPATTGGTLAAIKGLVYATGFGSGSTNLTVDDSGDTLARTVTLTSAAVTGLGNPAPIKYAAGVSSLTVNGSKGASTYTIQSTQAGTATTINAGPANDTFQVGDTTHPLSDLQGVLTLIGGGGTDKATLSDTAQSQSEVYYVTTNPFFGGATAGVDFSGLKGLTFNAGTGSVGLVVIAVAPTLPVTFNGGGGSDTLYGPDDNNTWAITGNNAGKLTAASLTGKTLGTVTFSKVPTLLGGTLADLFKLSPGKSLSGGIGGSGGIETIDYSLWTTGVTVNLATGTATNIAGGLFAVENINGGKGNDSLTGDSLNNIIRGGGGNDTIVGGGGNDILIGGQGAANLSAAGSGRSILIGGKSTVAETLTGSAQDDILIGGYTKYDAYSLANDQALMAILAEWTSGDSEATRESKITSGVGPGAKDKLKLLTTVFSDGASDTINGNGAEPGDTDWIIDT
jgi:hypothetical protein